MSKAFQYMFAALIMILAVSLISKFVMYVSPLIVITSLIGLGVVSLKKGE